MSTSTTRTPLLISPKTLLSTPPTSYKALDCTWHMPSPTPRSPRTEYTQAHLPNAQFFDLDGVCNTVSPYPHMLPTPSAWSTTMGELGIGRDDWVVCYDTYGVFSAARVVWMCKVFGHRRVSLLDGGLAGWKEAGGEVVVSGEEKVESVEYGPCEIDEKLVKSFEEVRGNAQKQNERAKVLDARAKGRFTGEAPEPRPGLSSGHIPYSLSLPFQALLTTPSSSSSSYTTYKPASELKETFEGLGVKEGDDVIMSCGTGVTASVLWLGQNIAFGSDGSKGAVYDGSWTEWAQRASADEGLIVKGDA
ncbi:hypothetical protein YB2330_004192 [Saitoella coloradoensis]